MMTLMTMIMLKMMMMTWEVPGGATAIIELRTRVNQSSEGNQPSAGLISRIIMMMMMMMMMMNLLAIALTFLSSRSASKIRGWL